MMRKLFLLCVVLQTLQLFGAASEEESGCSALARLIIKRVQNVDCNNDVEVMLYGCKNFETGKFELLQDATLAPPTGNIFSSKPGQEKDVFWLVPSSHEGSRSRIFTHHSTVYPFVLNGALYFKRRKKGEEAVESTPVYTVKRSSLEAFSEILLIMRVLSDGKYEFEEVQPDSTRAVVLRDDEGARGSSSPQVVHVVHSPPPVHHSGSHAGLVGYASFAPPPTVPAPLPPVHGVSVYPSAPQ